MNEQARHITVWEDCLRIIEQLLSPEEYATWFKPIRSVKLVGSTLTIEVPSDYYRNYIESAHLDMLSKVLHRQLGKDAKLVYMVRPVLSQEAMTVPASQNISTENRPIAINTFKASGTPGAMVIPGLKRLRIDSRLNKNYTFENLIEGSCNKMGVTAGIDISNKPGKTPFNPLFIFGGPGLGKTHLAQAVGLSIHEQYPELVVLYVTGNEFKTQYMNAVNVHNKLTDFLAFYMKIDVLIMDDIQELSGQGNQNAFFNIFNHLHQNGKQLILTSDRAPKDLSNFEERLLSRFKWGLSVELGRPDYATRLAMLKSRCYREGVIMPDEVLEYIALHVTSNFRELEGVLISMIAHATYEHRDCTLELAADVVGTVIGDTDNDLSIGKVQDAVCEYFNVSKADLASTSRKRQIAQARQIAMFLCRNLISTCSLSTIGEEIGGRDHSTVLHACATVQNLMSTDRLFKKYITDLKMILQPSE